MSDTEHDGGAPGNDRAESSGGLDTPRPMYASDIQILVEPGGIQLIFRRFLPATPGASEPEQSTGTSPLVSEVIGRVVLPPLAAERLPRLLPGRLADQRQMAEDYARATARAADSGTRPANHHDSENLHQDPFLAALAAAELDDEPYTDAQRAAALAGWEACQRGETVSWEDVRRSPRDEPESSKISTS